jgi:MFS family permease
VISLERYAELFRVPHMRATLLASILGRIPIGMSTLAILLFVQHRTRSFAFAGSTAALYVLGLAAVAPIVGRVIDRFGPRPLLTTAAILYPALLLALIALVTRQAGPLAIAICATLAGATLPPITICMRALYPRLLQTEGLLQTAYSVDSALVEMIFIAGPTLVAACVAAGFPSAALAAAALCALIGAALFLRAPPVRSWRAETVRARRDLLGPLRCPSLLAVFAAAVLFALSFGLFEVAVTALAAERGSPGAAGLILGVASIGSAAGALIYGGREWRAPLRRQFPVAVMLMAAGLVVLAPISNLYLLGSVSIVAAAPMATVIAVQSLLISRLAPRPMLAESFTWSATCLLGGISAGFAIGGVLTEYASPQVMLAVAAIPPLLAAAVVQVGGGAETCREPHQSA